MSAKQESKVKTKKAKSIKKDQALGGLFSKILGEQKELNKYQLVISKIKKFEETISKWKDDKFKKRTLELRKEIGDLEGEALEAKLNELLPEAFAIVREASVRTTGMKHFPVQMIGGMVMHDGRVAEMKTGEGKTLSATVTVYLNSLPLNNQVHMVTVNDYLARRDASWMGQIYDFLGLSIGIIQNQASFYFKLGQDASESADKKRELGFLETYEDGEKEDAKTVLDVKHLMPCDRKRAYWDTEKKQPVDVVFGVNSEFGFDYLRDNMASTPNDVVQRAGLKVAIIDEIDSILIDEARTPLIISNQAQDSSDDYKKFSTIVSKLTPVLDYEVDEKRKIATLTQDGVKKIESMLGITSLYESEENVKIIHFLEQALRARTLFKKDEQYVVVKNEIVIVDENTGRMMFGRRYNQGLHQAIEAKEGVEIKAENKTVASITFQNYFRLYNKLAGMTGTAATESEELYKIYELLVVSIPTNEPVVRIDYTDYIYKSEMGKFQSLVRDIKEIHSTGQPILVGTSNIDKNQLLCKLLDGADVPYQVLNAKNHEQEARIISNAGKKFAVTIATNIAGRGVDIKLGGEKPESTDKKAMKEWKKENEEVIALGGLYVIGTERHESRRIDNQLRGRSGRQGDPGKSRFYVSLEDYIVRVFGGDKSNYFKMLPIEDDQPIENVMLASLIEQAQKKIEGFNYDVRKRVTEYDDVINKQRQVIYEKRNNVLFDNKDFDWKSEIVFSFYNAVSDKLSRISKKDKKKVKIEKSEELSKELNRILNLEIVTPEHIHDTLKKDKFNPKNLTGSLTKEYEARLEKNWSIYQEHVKSGLARYVYLRAIDMLWTEHLVTIDHLNDSVRLRGYSQKDPLVEFKYEGMRLFEILVNEIDKEVSHTVFKVNPDLVPQGIIK